MNDGSNRLEGGFGCSSNFHVKRAARAFAFKNRKVRLFRILAKAAIAKVRHHAHDFDVRLDVKPGALTDAGTERAPSGQVSFGKGLVHDRRPVARLAQRPGVASVEVSPGDYTDTQRCKELWAYGIQMDRAIGGVSLIGLNRHGVAPASTGQQL